MPGAGGPGGGGPGGPQRPNTEPPNYGGYPRYEPENHETYLGVSTGNDKFASKVQAKLARKRFDDYMDRFAPVERQLADRAMSDEALQEGLADADEAVSSTFDSARGQTERRLSRYGVSQTADQQAATERRSGLAEVKTRVNARNTVRRRERDRKMALMSGGGLSSVGASKDPRSTVEE